MALNTRSATSNFSIISSKGKISTLRQKVIDQNLKTIVHVQNSKKEFKHIGAFQTRNIPHFVHEKIIERLLEECDHIVINPLVGPKSGDVVIERLHGIYKYISKTKYVENYHFISLCQYVLGP